MLGFIVKLFVLVLVRKVRDVWEWLNCIHVAVATSEAGAVMSRCGFRSVPYLEVNKNALGPRIVSAVRSLEVVAQSEVANVLQVWDFQSVTRALSALGSVSASRSVRSGRFYCSHFPCRMSYKFGCITVHILHIKIVKVCIYLCKSAILCSCYALSRPTPSSNMSLWRHFSNNN